jgi:hypothetical protein
MGASSDQKPEQPWPNPDSKYYSIPQACPQKHYSKYFSTLESRLQKQYSEYYSKVRKNVEAKLDMPLPCDGRLNDLT